MKLYVRLDNLEQELQKRLHDSQVDISLIVEATRVLVELGYNPNEVYERIIERVKDKAKYGKSD